MLFRPFSNYFKIKWLNPNNLYYPFYSSLIDRFFMLMGIITKAIIISIPLYIFRWSVEDMTINFNNPKILGDPWFHQNHSILPPIFLPHPTYNVKENYQLEELLDEIDEEIDDLMLNSRLYNILDPRRESNHVLYEGYELDNRKRNLDEKYFKFSKNEINNYNLSEKEMKNQKEKSEFLKLKNFLKNEKFYPIYYNN